MNICISIQYAIFDAIQHRLWQLVVEFEIIFSLTVQMQTTTAYGIQKRATIYRAPCLM